MIIWEVSVFWYSCVSTEEGESLFVGQKQTGIPGQFNKPGSLSFAL